ncbi:MAG: nucleotidyl transferase AbiEii/AbiGii toxin family protein [Deltaproteobacteria bacterium]|nr:nucleotidyl transferase AbiEii/AbiGii toxin family protein [Deltaproteobacteria bacterium]
MDAREPIEVIPDALADAVGDLPYWFVIGGQAVRCFCPYRPSRDVDFGVASASDLDELVGELESRGSVEVIERSADTIHLRFEGVNVSVFVLEKLSPHVVGRRLGTTGVLATKLHAILDRGTRRDFFDLYVTLQHHSLGIAACLEAMREVFEQHVSESLLLRALTYFDDAEREAPLPGEGPNDWKAVKGFFLERVGDLLVPPTRALDIQKLVVDVRQR